MNFQKNYTFSITTFNNYREFGNYGNHLQGLLTSTHVVDCFGKTCTPGFLTKDRFIHPNKVAYILRSWYFLGTMYGGPVAVSTPDAYNSLLHEEGPVFLMVHTLFTKRLTFLNLR